MEGQRPGLGAKVAESSQTTVGQLATFLEAHATPDPKVAALDLQNLVRGMIDGAPGADPERLIRPILRAAMCYIHGLILSHRVQFGLLRITLMRQLDVDLASNTGLAPNNSSIKANIRVGFFYQSLKIYSPLASRAKQLDEDDVLPALCDNRN